ncbi:MAG: hypothetical protein L3K08_06570 [Thermoplasmata archaeon]|nr:hypothetical protein [Thermoplasmata archaeon]
MAYDASSNSVVLFSGRTSAAGGLVRDTWSFAQGQWTQLHPAISPPARFDSSLVPDANGTGLILFGGLGNATNGVLNDTWWYHAGSSGPYWTNLTSSAGPGPSARWGAASANLSSLRVDVLYGGNSWNGTLPFTNGSLSDTWLFDGSRWHLQSTKTNPGPRYSASLAFDQVDGVDVLFGGFNRTGHPIGSTWIFNGSAWFAPNLGPVRPHARVGGAMTWATGWARGIDLLVGGAYGGSEVFGGPYAIASEIPLIVTTPVGSSTSTDPQSPVTFTEATFGGVPPLQYHWNDLPLPCTGMNGPAVACIPNASSTNSEYFQPFVSVEDAVNEVLNSSATYLVVYAPLSLSSLDLAPDPVNVGTAVTISVQRTGGASPLNLTYTGLPPGCVSENLTSFTCTPTAAGTYDVNVTAVDPYGESASLVSTVTVQSNGLSAQTTTGLWYLGFGAVLVASVIFLGIRRSRQKASSRPSPSTPLAPWTPPAETSRSPPSEPPNRPGA